MDSLFSPCSRAILFKLDIHDFGNVQLSVQANLVEPSRQASRVNCWTGCSLKIMAFGVPCDFVLGLCDIYSCFGCSLVFDSTVFKKSNRIECPPMIGYQRLSWGEIVHFVCKLLCFKRHFSCWYEKSKPMWGRQVGFLFLMGLIILFLNSAGYGLPILLNAPSILPRKLLSLFMPGHRVRNIKSHIQLPTACLDT